MKCKHCSSLIELSGKYWMAMATATRICQKSPDYNHEPAEPAAATTHMTEVSKGIFTSTFCTCPSPYEGARPVDTPRKCERCNKLIEVAAPAVEPQKEYNIIRGQQKVSLAVDKPHDGKTHAIKGRQSPLNITGKTGSEIPPKQGINIEDEAGSTRPELLPDCRCSERGTTICSVCSGAASVRQEPCQCGDGGCIECWPENRTKESLVEELKRLRALKSQPAAPRTQGRESETPKQEGQLTHSRNCPERFRSDDDCTCGLQFRIHLQTEQTMSAAWRKRAEEAEASLAQARTQGRELELLREVEELRGWKESAISVMPPMQEIGRALDVKLGQSIHDKILPGIERLKKLTQARTQPAPKCPKCGADISGSSYVLTVKCPSCKELFPVNGPADFAQFFTALPEATKKEE